jgi:dipeptidase D
MSDVLAQLEPRSLWKYFSAIADVPRPSKHEEKIVEYVRSFAAEHGFEVKSDAVGNLIVYVPATPGHENAPTVIIQGHLDMVCEKNKDVEFDFMNQGIRLKIDGEYVCADGTTLGSDNGIGIAAALAAATDPSVVHPPLELLFTVDEETGLTGAMKLDGSLLKGRTMLNLDSEEDGVLFVGCAGGQDTTQTLPVAKTAPPSGAKPFLLEVTGLRGGHSGLNIHENRGNALKILARVLQSALDAGVSFQLASLTGGSKHNAIPREAEATIYLAADAEAKFRKTMESLLEDVKTELKGIDEGIEIKLGSSDSSAQVLVEADRDRLIRLVLALPHGVLAMSAAIPGLVETSSNMAIVSEGDNAFELVTSSRSSVMPSLRAVIQSVRTTGEAIGAKVEVEDGYPGWNPNMSSPVLGVVRDVYTKVWGSDPKVTAIHAGLECGLLGEKVPGLDMVSFGPHIEGAHSPEERVDVPSVDRFWTALKDVLGRLASA